MTSPVVKLVAQLVVAVAMVFGGVLLWRFSEVDDAPGGIVVAWLIIVGASVLAVRAIQRKA